MSTRQRQGQRKVRVLDNATTRALDVARSIEGRVTMPHVQRMQRTAVLPEAGADVVLSDMAPNLSGIHAADQDRAIALAELALDLAAQVLVPSGVLVVKLFQGSGFDPWLAEARKLFTRVTVRKPKASRPRSREVYAVAEGLRAGAG